LAGILFLLFNFIKVKQKTYLLIPALAYLGKEIYNFIFVYKFTLFYGTVIALVIEPLLVYGLTWTINKYWLGWR
jgi:hypothetical protein